MIPAELAPFVVCQGIIRLGGLGMALARRMPSMGSFVVSNRDRDPPCTNCTGRGMKLGLLDGTRWHLPPMVSRLRVIVEAIVN